MANCVDMVGPTLKLAQQIQAKNKVIYQKSQLKTSNMKMSPLSSLHQTLSHGEVEVDMTGPFF